MLSSSSKHTQITTFYQIYLPTKLLIDIRVLIQMPTYDPYTSLLESEHITAQHHSVRKSHLPDSFEKAERPTLCRLPKMTPQFVPNFPKSYEEGIDRWDGPMWPGQDHAGLNKGETEVLPHDYKVKDSHINEIKSYEQDIDDWDGPMWPNQDHAELRKGETEVLPHDYKVTESHINEIGAYEDGIDDWDGPMWPGQDHAGLREGETEVLPHDYTVSSSTSSPTSEDFTSIPSSLEEGIDDWDGPIWPGKDHAGLWQGETEVLPKRYRVAKGGRLIPLNEKDKPKVEIEIIGYEDGIDRWDGPMWPGQNHAGLREGETEVLPSIYHVTQI
jgi:hypothetical protein